MAALKTLFQGDSLSIGFTFGTYDTSRIEHSYVYLNEVEFTTTLDAGVLRCAIPSSSTKQFCGNVPVLLVIDDSVFGVRKTAIGNIYFQSTGTFSDSSVNTGYNIEVSVTIEEDSTAVSVTLLEAFRGYSSYDIYVKYTTDDPVLTESEWNDAYNDLVSYKIAAEAARNEAEGFAGEALGYRNETEGYKNTVLANTILLGGIAHNAAAPTPGKSGIYEFTSAGTKPAWLTGGVASVAIGDRVIVVYSDSIYTYTYQANPNTNIEQVRSQATNKVPSSKLFDDELVQVRSDLKLFKANNEEIWGFKNLLTSVVAGKSTALTSPNYYIATDVKGAISNYISCVSGEMFCIQGFLPLVGHYIIFLDENKNVISGISNATAFTQSAFPYCGYFTVPVDSSIKYFVLTLYRENNIEITTGNIQKPFDANTAVVAKITSISELPLKIKIKQNTQIINDAVTAIKSDDDYKNIKESVVIHSEVEQVYDSKTSGAFINNVGVHTAFAGYNYNTYAIEKSDLKDYYVSAAANGSAIDYVNYYNNSGIFIGSEYAITNGSSLSKAKLTIPSGAVTLKLNYQSGAFLYCDTKTYENLPEKINNKLNKDDTTYQNVLSALSLIKTLDYTSIVNTLVNADGTDSAVWVNQSYWYAIYTVEKSDTKKYYLTHKYTTGSGFYAANYHDINGALLGHEYEVGTLDITKAVLTIPTGAVTMKVNYYTSTGLPIVYLDDTTIIEDVPGKIDIINNEIDAINSSSAFSKKMEITKNTDSVYIRSKYNDTQDLVIVYKINDNNKYFSPYSSYIGLATDTTSNIVASNVVHYTHDSTPPISTDNYWFISGEHGYIVPKVVASGHNKTLSDIDSWWKTADDKYFQLAGIDGTSLILVPKLTIDGGGTGKDISDYSFSTTVLTTLTHVSGATNTSDITVTTMGRIQLYSSTHNISKKFYCDGIEITANGVYKCNEFSVTDVHEVINPTSITQYYPTIIASSVMARNTFTYKFTGLSCFISNTFEVVNRPIWLIYYGAMQPLGLTSTGDYHSYIFIPKVKSITNGEITTDWKYPQDCTSPNQTWARTEFSNSVEHLMAVDDFPERIIQYYKNPATNELLIGFAAGYSLLSSSTVNSKRKNLTQTAFSFAPSIGNKFYSRAIEGRKFTDSLLPIGTVLNFNYYYTYFKPSEACQVYWYKEGNSWIVYAHSHAEQICNIELSELMESMIATIIEKTTDTELLTDTVVNNKLIAEFPAGANYIVVKLS